MKKINQTLFNRIKNKVLYHPHFKGVKGLWFNLALRDRAYKKIKERIKRKDCKDPIKVIFFVMDIKMWKYETLFKRLKENNIFNPVIIPYPLLWNSKTEQKKAEQDIVNYCKTNNFNYLIGYNIDSGEYIPAKDLKADFVCFTQPYNNYPYFWKLERFYKNALIFYYPYGLHIDFLNSKNISVFYNLLTHSVAWKLFYNTQNGFETFKKNFCTHGKNYSFVGNILHDRIKNNIENKSLWKDSAHNLKRIIWAPHHTIIKGETIPFATFMTYCEEMKNLAAEYRDKIEFAFRPHPLLRQKLNDIWGKEKTDSYYEFWSNGPNTFLSTDDYFELFISSDAMIHDCVTFMMDYLLVNKPVMFLNKNKMSEIIDGLTLDCHRMHYSGNNITDVRNFIENVIMGNKDTLKEKRTEFIKYNFINDNSDSPTELMYKEMLNVSQN